MEVDRQALATDGAPVPPAASGLLSEGLPRESYAVGATFQAISMVLVIILGALSTVARQVVGKSMKRFTYMLGLTNATAYVFIYLGILFYNVWAGAIPRKQVSWVWNGWQRVFSSLLEGLASPPYVKLFIVQGLGDALGDVIGYICTPYVSGPIHSLLSNCTVLFTVVLSFLMLRKKCSFAQCVGLVGVEGAVLIGVIPSIGGIGANSTNGLFALLLGGSCFFNALAFVLKERAFQIYQHSNPRDSLSIFVVISHEAVFQLPFTLLCVPIAYYTGQTDGADVFTYLSEGFACLGGNTDEEIHCQYAGLSVGVSIAANIAFNLCILLNVKYNGSLATFVAIKAVSPTSALLFAFVDWPLLGTTPVEPITWAIFAIMIPFIAFYTWASHRQRGREENHPSMATCCWPLGCTTC